MPRLVNLVCENALIEAYGIRAEFVTPEIIQTVAKQFRLDVETTNRDRDLYPANLEHNLRHLVRALLEDFRNGRRAAKDERPLSLHGPEK